MDEHDFEYGTKSYRLSSDGETKPWTLTIRDTEPHAQSVIVRTSLPVPVWEWVVESLATPPISEPSRCQAFVSTHYPGSPIVQCEKPIHHDEIEHEGPGPQGPVKWHPAEPTPTREQIMSLLTMVIDRLEGAAVGKEDAAVPIGMIIDLLRSIRGDVLL